MTISDISSSSASALPTPIQSPVIDSVPVEYRTTKEGGKYTIPWGTQVQKGFIDVIKWTATSTKPKFTEAELDKEHPVVPINWDKLRNPNPSSIQCTWIGHASMYVQMEGVNIMTDPVFSDRCSPVQFAGPRRYRKTPCKIQELPKPDIVLISHNHYDHLDLQSVKDIGDGPIWIVPAGLKSWFANVGIRTVIEMEWWQEVKVGEINIVAFPCQHWSTRTSFDAFETLWCSFGLFGSHKKFYFSGDTGYNNTVFKLQGDLYGPFDLACIPIGAYEPRWFMEPQHVNPAEAVLIHEEIKSKKSIGMHWGTFVLTDEPVLEPPVKLAEELRQKDLHDDDFVVVNIGQTLSLE
eukprot:TRINITY_DN4828_c0_g1_i1.p1 TRINITY_DN4828_c0_g1~~TRINITY_DN4828_c0_g1_i1.p1  ORF type:complete len:350 (-),score=78.01 TRINITY_DN4828_c0_g1_i1:27-1076(-)